MNAQNVDNKPKVRKESKNKIRVEFDRTPLKERLKAKFLSMFFLKKVVWYVFRLVLLIGVSYIVLFPFFTKIAGSFMAPEDFVDVTVRLIPKNWTLNTYKAIWVDLEYVKAFSNTLLLSLSTAVVQMFVCCFIAYGLAKFKFKGNKFVFMAVIFSLIIPHQTLQLSMFMKFRYFDILGIFKLFGGGGLSLFGKTITNNALASFDIFPAAWKNFTPNGLNLTNSFWPLIILSISGLAFKNGLYIFMLRQFFRGVPDELEESAYIDGSGVFHTFLTIILPISIPMMITVFLFAFSWQWTDDFYTTMFFTSTKTRMLSKLVEVPKSLETNYAGQNLYYAAIRNTCGIMIIAPLVVMYLFCQRYLVQGIERSGLTAD
ncbi:MAG: carbohydrate ABC transporter permease [Ruminococcaceae bacterium]|nr:carbohydrate ABC transporter permease [Oscillospiraceae bacterium]